MALARTALFNLSAVSDLSSKPWPGNVPSEADATRMLLGEVPPGEFQSVVETFRASLGPVEKGVLDLRSNQALVTALAVKWRLTAAIAVAPVSRSEVDQAAVDALLQESADAALGLASATNVTDFNLKQILESTMRSLTYLQGKLKAAIPKEAPAPAPAAPPAEPAAAAPEARAPEALPPPPAPAPAAPAMTASQQDAANARKKTLLLIAAAAALLAAVVHGYRFFSERAEEAAARERFLELPAEVSRGDITHITLKAPSPEKVAELEQRAQAEGKKLLKISETEFQLYGAGSAPPAPAPPGEAPTEGQGAAPAEGENPAPAEGEKGAPADGEKPAPAGGDQGPAPEVEKKPGGTP